MTVSELIRRLFRQASRDDARRTLASWPDQPNGSCEAEQEDARHRLDELRQRLAQIRRDQEEEIHP